MFSFLKYAVLFTCLVTSIAHATQFNFFIEKGPNWELTAQARADFDQYLEEQRLLLKHTLPELDFPASFDSFRQAFEEYVYAGTTKFKNRSSTCGFLNRVRNNLKDTAAIAEFNRLTESGRVCIPADIEKSRWQTWSYDLIRFFWDRPWIAVQSENLSLEGLIKKNLPAGAYVRPEIRLATNTELDAFGYAKSAADLEVIRTNRSLSKIFDIASLFDPNDWTTIGDLGAELRKFAQEHSYSMAQAFTLKPLIYVSAGWSPDSLVELLVHEYGHVYQALNSSHFSTNESSATYKYDAVHNEGVAEAFAWMNLREIYPYYPEVKIFHILKLQQMGKFREDDSHYVGAGSLFTVFHSDTTGTFTDLEKYVRARDLSEYMREKGVSTLRHGPADPKTKLVITF
jgi:hypothetical protein